MGQFELGGVVPWGRRLAEYQAFFDLGDLRGHGAIVDVGAGPSSFAAEACRLGAEVTAVDPVYAHGADEIRSRFEATRGTIVDGVRRAEARFVWTRYGSPEGMLKVRQEALELFLEDFKGLRGARYVVGSLPTLPFADDAFGLALVSHLLFLYAEELSEAFHVAAMRELLRIAPEVRAFPLIELEGAPSRHLDRVREALSAEGHESALIDVPFEFQRGATQMLRITRRTEPEAR
jgi:hypothetical protein